MEASVGEEAETVIALRFGIPCGLMEMERRTNTSHRKHHIVSGVLGRMFSRIRAVVQNGVQRPLINHNFQENSLKKEDSARLSV